MVGVRHMRLIGALCAALAFSPGAQSWSKQQKLKVRTELIELQQTTGLTVASVGYHGVEIVSFANRSWHPLGSSETLKKIQDGTLSPDGRQIVFQSPGAKSYKPSATLAVAPVTGADMVEYPDLPNASSICWAPDKSRLVLTVYKPALHQNSRLVILEMSTGLIEEIYSARFAHAETQCFSPDGKQIVFEADTSLDDHHPDPHVFVYDLATRGVRQLGNGAHPTWSPDGTNIALLDRKVFYLLNPLGGERRKFFKNTYAYSALWWSPDSRFVAYNAYCCLWESLKFMADIGQLRVRRLADGAEDWVANTSPPSGSYSWLVILPDKHDLSDKQE
jgi:dipeptidyl aminopeptidase/acylaminoacyl peptidase